MNIEEIKIPAERLKKAELLVKRIERCEKNIETIRFEIDYQQNGSGDLNIMEKEDATLNCGKILGYFADDKTIIEFGELVIDFLQKKVDEMRAELKEL